MDSSGIVTDLKGRTAVPGLYAVGRSRSIDPGVYIGGFALSTTATTGYLTGEDIASYIGDLDKVPAADDEQIVKYKERMESLLNSGGIAPKDVMRKIQDIVFPYDVSILKTEESLTRALGKLDWIKDNLLERMGANDAHYLMKLYEVLGTAFITELYLKASLERKESRAGHYRDDYPNRAEDGLYWLNVKKMPAEKRKCIVFLCRWKNINIRLNVIMVIILHSMLIDGKSSGECL